MATSKFEMVLSLGRVHGQAMSLQVLVNDREVLQQPPTDQDQINLTFDVELPARIEFVTQGKDVMDTVLDDRGQILQDKYIKVDRLIIDRMPVERWILESRLFEFVEDSGVIRHTNYFGSNGCARFEINTKDSFDWFLGLLVKD